MENFTHGIVNNKHYEKIPEQTSRKQEINFVFEQNPELASFGTPEQYSRYLETIFPESKIKDILYHGSKDKFDFFDKGKTRDYSGIENYEHYGFYFGDKYSAYGKTENHETVYKYMLPVLLNIKNPYYLAEEDTKLSSIDLSTPLKDQIKFSQENDGLIQLDFSNNLWLHNTIFATWEEYETHKENLHKNILNYFLAKGLKEEDLTREMIVDYVKEFGINSIGVQEIMVPEPEQIHILGSKKDIDKFKEFVENTEEVKAA